MSKTYAPSASMAANAHVDAAKYDEMYAASVNRPRRLLGRARQAVGLDQTLHQSEKRLL